MYTVETTEAFDEWFASQTESVQDKMFAGMMLLRQYGHQLARPYADTLQGSKFN